MSPMLLLDDLRRRGFTLWVENDKIRFRGTREPLATELLAELKSNKLDLIRILADESLPRPYLNRVGDLMIPFNCDPKYQWWVDGQSIRETKEEIRRNLVN